MLHHRKWAPLRGRHVVRELCCADPQAAAAEELREVEAQLISRYFGMRNRAGTASAPRAGHNHDPQHASAAASA